MGSAGTLGGGRIGAILLINIVLLIAGCFLDMPAIINLLVPPLLPLALRCGMSLPHFGVMVVIYIAIGLLTPPQAHNLEAAAHLAGVDMREAARGATPCLVAMLATLAVVAFVPTLSLWFPRLLGWAV